MTILTSSAFYAARIWALNQSWLMKTAWSLLGNVFLTIEYKFPSCGPLEAFMPGAMVAIMHATMSGS